jgi:hypothetical protein
MDPRGVEKDQLGVFHIPDAQDPISCRLRFFGDNGDLVAHETVKQG